MVLDIKVLPQENNVYCIRLAGSIEEETYRSLEKVLKDAINRSISVIIIDMQGVDYVSSAGIGILVGAKTAAKEKSAAFRMINLQPKVKKVFEVMRLASVLNIAE